MAINRKQLTAAALLALICIPLGVNAQPVLRVVENLDWNEMFEDLFIGGPYRISLEVSNVGDERLEIREIRSDNEVFTVEPEALNLEPGDVGEVIVTMEAEEPGEYDGTLTFFSNDPENGELQVALHAEVDSPPMIDVEPNAIEEEMFLEMMMVERWFTISNEGDAVLRFVIETEIIADPNQNEGQPGDLLGEVAWQAAGENEFKAGIAYDLDNELLLLTTSGDRRCAVVDPAADFQIVREWQPPGLPMSAAWLDGRFYILMFNANEGQWEIRQYDINGNQVAAPLDLDFIPTSIAASQEEEILLIGDEGLNIQICAPNGNLVATIDRGNYAQFIDDQQSRSICWVDDHPDGQLWISTPGHIWQLHVEPDNWEADALVVDWATDVEGEEWDGIGHDGENLIYGAFSLPEYRIYEDGVNEAHWIFVNPEEGELASGETMDVFVTLDARGLIEGDYEAALHILSNDPFNPDLVVSVTIFVPGWPDFEFRWPEENGFPDEFFFQPTLIGSADTVVAVCGNNGNANMEIWIEFDNEFFRAVPENIILNPGEEQEILFIFQPEEAREYQGTCIFTTNDPNENEIAMAVRGEGVEEPRIQVEPEQLLDEYQFIVRNVGNLRLDVDSTAFGGESGEDWFDPWRFELEPGEEQVVELGLALNPEHEDVEFLIEIFSNDPRRPVVELIAVFPDWPDPHWPIEPGGESHSILVTNIEFDGDMAPDGWEVGVFTPGGILAGAGVWHQELLGIAAWGDDAGQEGIQGFEDGQRMAFRLWDLENDVEYPSNADIQEGDDRWRADGLTFLTLTVFDERQLRIAFEAGWNLMSLNVVPPQDMWWREEGPDVRRMLAQLRRPNAGLHHVILFKSERGSYYNPNTPWDFTNIPYWNLQEGYQIKVDENVEAEWQGEPIDPQADIRIAAGWKFIPYYPTYLLGAEARDDFCVLSPILDAVVIAKNDLGQFMIPSRDFSNMEPWREGKGYQVNVREPVVLNYPEERQMMMSDDDVHQVDPVHFVHKSRTGHNMSLLMKPEAESQKPLEIGVFTESGLCVGASAYSSSSSSSSPLLGMAVWGDDPSTPEIDGAVEGEALGFRLWDGQAETPLLLSWEEGTAKYETDGIGIASLNLDSRFQLSDFSFQLYPAFPNPFNASTRITFGLDKSAIVRVGVNDLEGREVAVLTDRNVYPTGQHSVVWNGEGLAAGVYLVKLETEGRTLTQKVVLIK